MEKARFGGPFHFAAETQTRLSGGLIALIDLLQQHVHELHAYLIEIENSTTLELPLTDSDFESLHLKNTRKDEVEEPAPLYAIR